MDADTKNWNNWIYTKLCIGFKRLRVKREYFRFWPLPFEKLLYVTANRKTVHRALHCYEAFKTSSLFSLKCSFALQLHIIWTKLFQINILICVFPSIVSIQSVHCHCRHHHRQYHWLIRQIQFQFQWIQSMNFIQYIF